MSHPPLFILCPLRSYSSLVAAMIGQHPAAYGLPELNLFLAPDLGRLWPRLARMTPIARDGLLRAVAQLNEGEQSADAVRRAQRWIAAHPAWTPAAVVDHLRQRAGGRMLVDKSPAYVMHGQVLERIRKEIPGAHFLHLTRHPGPTGRSILKLLARNTAWNGVLATDDLDPERVWQRGHGNVRAFLSALPAGQAMQVKAEDLLRAPDVFLPQICEWLDLDAHEGAIGAMLCPEESPFACLGPENAPYGNDPGFLETPRLDFERLQRIPAPPLDAAPGFHGKAAWEPRTFKLAREFGYG